MIKTTIFRVDASTKVGVGHISRSLIFAKQLKNKNIVFCYHKLPKIFQQKIKKNGFKLQKLKTNKTKEFIKKIKKIKPNKIIIDNYQIDFKDEKKIKKAFKKAELIVFDDTYEKHFCDKIINPNIYADLKKYPQKAKKILLLRDEFYQAKKIKDKKDHILLMLGGMDFKNLMLKILKILKNQKVIVITTSANRHIKKLQKYAKKHKNITIDINSNKVAKTMKTAKLAIITPSVSANEAIFLQTNLLAIKVANNQKYMYQYLKKNGFCALEKFDKKELKKCLKKLL